MIDILHDIISHIKSPRIQHLDLTLFFGEDCETLPPFERRSEDVLQDVELGPIHKAAEDPIFGALQRVKICLYGNSMQEGAKFILMEDIALTLEEIETQIYQVLLPWRAREILSVSIERYGPEGREYE